MAWVRTATLLADSHTLAADAGDLAWSFWDLTEGTRLRTVPLGYPVCDAVVSPDGHWLLAEVPGRDRREKTL